jgi:hypothetical protein
MDRRFLKSLISEKPASNLKQAFQKSQKSKSFNKQKPQIATHHDLTPQAQHKASRLGRGEDNPLQKSMDNSRRSANPVCSILT